MDELTELVALLARALVDNPDEVQVDLVEGEHTTVYELTVAKADLGKVIGKEGRTARAMRTVLTAACAKQRRRAILEILE